jgi:hypothetical protein
VQVAPAICAHVTCCKGGCLAQATHACHSTHISACSLSFFIRVRTCCIAGASPLLFEVTFHKKYQDWWDKVGFDVDAIFS